MSPDCLLTVQPASQPGSQPAQPASQPASLISFLGVASARSLFWLALLLLEWLLACQEALLAECLYTKRLALSNSAGATPKAFFFSPGYDFANNVEIITTFETLVLETTGNITPIGATARRTVYFKRFGERSRSRFAMCAKPFKINGLVTTCGFCCLAAARMPKITIKKKY